MGAKADLLAVVAPNGLGHARRVIGVLSRVVEHAPQLSTTLVCAPEAVARLRTWPRAATLFDRSQVHTDVMEPGVTWSGDPTLYDDGRLLAWEERLAALDVLANASLVVSDNLAGVLRFRGDTVLMGSFLASEVLAAAHPRSAAVRAYVDHERELLARHRPPMLCVGDIAMPEVFARTRAVPLPWMCESVSASPGIAARRDRAGVVGLLGGRTGAADDLLLAAARALRAAEFDLAAPGDWPLEGNGWAAFGFGPADFAALSVAVCRPGMGTVSDCIAQGVPMVLLHEGNPELAHNAARLAALGVAADLGTQPAAEAVVAAVRRLVEPAGRAAVSARFAELERDGLDRAARWLLQRGAW